MSTEQPRTWEEVGAALDCIVIEHPSEYLPACIANAKQLIGVLRENGCPPPDIGPGYWPTFRITWDASGAENLELEVFEDKIEVYRFYQGRTDIWYEYHEPGSDYSDAFLSELPRKG